MFQLLLSSYLLAVVLQQTLVEGAANCGMPKQQPNINLDGRQRIVGGSDALPHSYPWMVSIHISPPNMPMKHGCGGALIRVNDGDATDIIVTAAHCINPNWKFKILAGAHSQSKPSPNQQTIDIVEVLQHEEFNIRKGLHNDIALMKLKTPVKFNDFIQPVCLPDANENLPAGTKGAVSGWGFLNPSTKASPDVLQQVMLPVISDKQCATNYGAKLRSKEMLCAGFSEGGQDACQNDSGGPYVTKQNGAYVLSGVVSWGEGCAVADKPGVFTRVPTYVKWIQEKSKKLSSLK